MLFKYNRKNPKLRTYYLDTVQHARKEVSDQIRFWKLVFFFFIALSVVVFGLLLYFAIANAINLQTRPDYVTAAVLSETVVHLSIIFGFSFIILLLSGVGLRKAFDNHHSLEKEIKLNGIVV